MIGLTSLGMFLKYSNRSFDGKENMLISCIALSCLRDAIDMIEK